jgi:isoaspartyl peptidase/L-asparaginase-like protein (Ntn-hydrolase superfamily)
VSAGWAVALHGGAGVHAGRSYARAEACLAELVRAASDQLSDGAPALDVVERAVAAMEASGLFVAGRGSAPNRLGDVELDAAIMDGATHRAGAVAALQGVASPVTAARRVMDATSHVLLVGQGATLFAGQQGLEPILDLETWLTTPEGFRDGDLDEGHGTVGAVARDGKGRLAAATSTGGTYGASPGRVGDSPLIGAGTWADDLVAVSCTGVGEAFIRAAAAHDLAARVRYGGARLETATDAVLRRALELGGDGGVIALSREGPAVARFNTDGMKRAWAQEGAGAFVGSVGDDVRRVG